MHSDADQDLFMPCERLQTDETRYDAPYVALTGTGGWQQQEQVRLWKEYIAWEMSNPQRLDSATLAQRVNLAFEQALMPLMHYPEASLPSHRTPIPDSLNVVQCGCCAIFHSAVPNKSSPSAPNIWEVHEARLRQQYHDRIADCTSGSYCLAFRSELCL